MVEKALSKLLALALVTLSSAWAQRTLEVWIMPNSGQSAEEFKALVAPFERANNLEVKVTVLDWGVAWSKITTAATSGVGPDLTQLGTTWVGAISAMGVLEPLDDVLQALGGQSAYLSAVWNTTRLEGAPQATALPWFSELRAFYYRKDALQAAGVDPPQMFASWTGFEEGLRKLKDSPFVDPETKRPLAPYCTAGKNTWDVLHNAAPWIWGAGGEIVRKAGSAWQSALNTTESLQGLFFFLSLAQKGYIPAESLEKNTAQIEADFQAGKCAVFASGPWMIQRSRIPEAKGGFQERIAAKQLGGPLPRRAQGAVHLLWGLQSDPLPLFQKQAFGQGAPEVPGKPRGSAPVCKGHRDVPRPPLGLERPGDPAGPALSGFSPVSPVRAQLP